jgi:hypothetical protein
MLFWYLLILSILMIKHNLSYVTRVVQYVKKLAYLPWTRRSWIKYSSLHLTGKSWIYRQNNELRDIWTHWFHTLIQNFTGCVYFLLAGQKQQDVTCIYIQAVLNFYYAGIRHFKAPSTTGFRPFKGKIQCPVVQVWKSLISMGLPAIY